MSSPRYSTDYKHSEEAREESAHDVEKVDASIDEKRLIRRIDIRIVPWLALLYLLSFLDRTNIGNAAIFGLRTDLRLSPTDYAACLAVFFAFYMLFEVPSNIILKIWRPSMWLPIIMIAWGATMIGMGFVHNYTELLVTRIFLGLTEAGLFPGVSYFLTLWYRRFEINLRIALFFSAATLAGAFGGLLARLIQEMNGIAGLQGWRWIFILEGIATVIIAIASFWMLYDYPDTAKFLSPAEKVFVQNRLKLDQDGLSSENKPKFVWQGLLDWKIWVFSTMYVGALMPLYCFSLFSPTLTANLGYQAAQAQLLSVPPYVLGAITTIAAGYLSDKYRVRYPFVMFFTCLSMLGFTLVISNTIVGLQYLGLHLAAAGSYPLIPLVLSWGANNIGGAIKRGVGVAVIVTVGNAGGIISSFIYPSTDAPRYYKGLGLCIAFNGMAFLCAAFMMVWLKAANRRKDERNASRGRPWTHQEKLAHDEEGDDADFFRYTL